MFCHKCMSCPFGNTHFSLLKGGNRKYSFFLCYSQGAGWQRELVLIILTHMDNIHCWGNGRGEMKGRPKWRESPQPTFSILIISLFGVIMINTPGKNWHQLFVDFVREDFAEFFPRIENLVCPRTRAPTFLDRVMFGPVTGKWIGEDALGAATMQEFNRPEKPAIWICWENLRIKFIFYPVGTILISLNYKRGDKSE